jgi:hypothetical protein
VPSGAVDAGTGTGEDVVGGMNTEDACRAGTWEMQTEQPENSEDRTKDMKRDQAEGQTHRDPQGCNK